MSRKVTLPLVALLSIGLLLAAGAPTRFGLDAGAATPSGAGGITREVLVAGRPADTPGRVLQLVRYRIAPGTTLPAHTHPGMQIAVIEAGTLHYTVLRGEAPITRAGSGGAPGPAEALAAGNETLLRPGDSVVEAERMLHFGRNAGPEPVVILAATLLVADRPPAETVEPALTPAL